MRGNNFQFSYSREASVKRRRDLNVKVYFYECNMNCLVLGFPPIKALKANEVGNITFLQKLAFDFAIFMNSYDGKTDSIAKNLGSHKP